MTFDDLVSRIRSTVVKSGLTTNPVSLHYIDRDWGVPPATRAEALADLTDAIIAGAPTRCREPDRVKFSSPICVAFVALAQPQPEQYEAMLVRAVKARK